MASTDLKVPYSEKDQAKALGAKWDAQRKTWFVPDGIDLARFKRWLPATSDLPLQAAHFALARTLTRCWKCSAVTTAYAIVIPAGGKVLEPGDDEFEDEWRILAESVALSHVDEISTKAADMIKVHAPGFYSDYSRTTNSLYWANHCMACGVILGDFYLHNEPGGAFFPLDQHHADSIVCDSFDIPIGASGNYGNNTLFP